MENICTNIIHYTERDHVIGINEGLEEHYQMHVSADIFTTTNVSYAPDAVSVTQLINKTKALLKNVDKKKEDINFAVPSHSWVYL